MLKEIEVQGLYEVFNHTIPLKEGNITIVIGENGIGKTIILKMLQTFFGKNFEDLRRLNFKYFTLTFSDNARIVVSKNVSLDLVFSYLPTSNDQDNMIYEFKREPSGNLGQLAIESFENNINNKLYEYINSDINFNLREYLPSYVEKIDTDSWLDRRVSRRYNTIEIVKKYLNRFPQEFSKQFNVRLPNWLIERLESVSTKLIETQRLLYKSQTDETNSSSSVEIYSNELIRKIRNVTVNATELAATLDRTYPNRLIAQITNSSRISELEIENGLNSLNAKRELLYQLGLLGTDNESNEPIISAIDSLVAENKDLLKDVLKIYLEDSKNKLTIYDELADKINLLVNIINRRFLYKTMSIDRHRGFNFISSVTGKKIPLSGLSSGEQHELVLFYQLLFNSESDILWLIDEPEISLNIKWQNKFIDDLREIIKVNNFFAIVATHSPDIIANNWDLIVQLKGK